MGYSRSIRGVFTGYSYVSVMCRLCIGYVSVIYRNTLGVGRGKMERGKVKSENGKQKGEGENGKVRGEKGKRQKEELFDKLVEQQKKDLHI